MSTTDTPAFDGFDALVKAFRGELTRLAAAEFDGHLLKATVALTERVAPLARDAVLEAFFQLTTGFETVRWDDAK